MSALVTKLPSTEFRIPRNGGETISLLSAMLNSCNEDERR